MRPPPNARRAVGRPTNPAPTYSTRPASPVTRDPTCASAEKGQTFETLSLQHRSEQGQNRAVDSLLIRVRNGAIFAHLRVLRRDISWAGWKVAMSGSLKEQAWGADGDAPPLDCWSIAGPSRGLRAWAGRSPLRHSGCASASSALTAAARPPLNTTSAAAEFGISPLRLSSDTLWDRQFPISPYGTATAQSLFA